MIQVPACGDGEITFTGQLTDTLRREIAAGNWLTSAAESQFRCMDGRPGLDGPVVGVSLPGASALPALVAAELLGRRGLPVEWDSLAALAVESCRQAGCEPGVHNDDSGHGSGCGALEFYSISDAFIANNSANIDEFHRLLGQPLPSAFPLSEASASDPSDLGSNRPSGVELMGSFRRAGLTPHCLQGEHQEQGVVYNLRRDTTLNRLQLAQVHPGLEIFNVDAWLLPWVAETSAKLALATGAREASEKNLKTLTDEAFAYATTYVTACIFKLCSPGTPVIRIA